MAYGNPKESLLMFWVGDIMIRKTAYYLFLLTITFLGHYPHAEEVKYSNKHKLWLVDKWSEQDVYKYIILKRKLHNTHRDVHIANELIKIIPDAGWMGPIIGKIPGGIITIFNGDLAKRDQFNALAELTWIRDSLNEDSVVKKEILATYTMDGHISISQENILSEAAFKTICRDKILEDIIQQAKVAYQALKVLNRMEELLPDIGWTGWVGGRLPHSLTTLFSGKLENRKEFEILSSGLIFLMIPPEKIKEFGVGYWINAMPNFQYSKGGNFRIIRFYKYLNACKFVAGKLAVQMQQKGYSLHQVEAEFSKLLKDSEISDEIYNNR